MGGEQYCSHVLSYSPSISREALFQAHRSDKTMLSRTWKISTILALTLALALAAYADNRTKLKPGWNLFSPQQDVEMGREVAKQAERQLSILNDRQATTYINALGKQLAAHAPGGQQYPFQFKIVNDKA